MTCWVGRLRFRSYLVGEYFISSELSIRRHPRVVKEDVAVQSKVLLTQLLSQQELPSPSSSSSCSGLAEDMPSFPQGQTNRYACSRLSAAPRAAQQSHYYKLLGFEKTEGKCGEQSTVVTV